MLQHLVYVTMIEMNWYIMELARVQLKLICMREEKLRRLLISLPCLVDLFRLGSYFVDIVAFIKDCVNWVY